LVSAVLLAATVGSGWASSSYTFDSGTWGVDWGGLTLTIGDDGKFVAPSTSLLYVWQDYNTTAGEYSSPGGGPGGLGELFDIEGMFYTNRGGYHDFLVVASMDASAFNLSGYGDTYFWRGDLCINPGTAWDYAIQANNTSGLGVKLGGAHPGFALTGPVWGYGAGVGAAADQNWRTPITWNGGNPSGYKPAGGGKDNDVPFRWGSNFYVPEAEKVVGGGVAGVEFFEPAGPIFTQDQGDRGLATYAFQVRVSNSLMEDIGGYRTATLATSCLNDDIELQAPGLPAFALAGVPPVLGAILRRRRAH
jgi:hypothetical protein